MSVLTLRPLTARNGAAALLLLVACGRSDVTGETIAASRLDAGVVSADGGRTDAGVTRDAGVRTGPAHVFTRSGDCARAGVEGDLAPAAGEALLLVKSSPQIECSGAGGDWLVGTGLSAEQLAFGNHACFFLPPSLMTRSDWFGLARVTMSATPITTPMGWCITPVTSSLRVLSWGLYPSELDAVNARAALLAP